MPFYADINQHKHVDFSTRDFLTCINLIPVWISNYIHYQVWGVILYPLPNFNNCTTIAWELKSNFIPLFIGHVTTYPCWIKVNPC